MLTKIRGTLRTSWGRLRASTLARLSTMSLDEQTRLSWAKHIESYADVPHVYKSFFDPLLADGRAFPYTVLTPPYEGFIHRTTEKLVCDGGHEIYVLERSGDGFEAQCYPLECISHVQVRTRLLDSRIAISGVTRQGFPASSTLKFNTVTDYLLAPFLESIRLASVDTRDAVPSSELAKFDHLVRVNFKFMNYAKRSLLGGERVVHAILQPEIRARVFTLLRLTFYRTVSPTHMSILTDRELIVIREEKRRSEDTYGGIWDYAPLEKIVSLSLSKEDSDLPELSIRLPEGQRLDLVFQASTRREVDVLLGEFERLTRMADQGRA